MPEALVLTGGIPWPFQSLVRNNTRQLSYARCSKYPKPTTLALRYPEKRSREGMSVIIETFKRCRMTESGFRLKPRSILRSTCSATFLPVSQDIVETDSAIEEKCRNIILFSGGPQCSHCLKCYHALDLLGYPGCQPNG